MRKTYIAAISAFILLVSPALAGAAPLLDTVGAGSLGTSSLDASSLDTGSLGTGSLGAGSFGSLGPEYDESYVAVEPTAGTLIATSGFDVKRDGFSYENWAEPDEIHRRSLTPEMMQSLYGDRICARVDGGDCILSATGAALQKDLNDGVAGGHCYGFAAMSGAFATGILDKSEYLSPGPNVFDDAPSDKFDGLISRYASTQYSTPTSAGHNVQSVAETIEKLKAAWEQGESYLLGFYGTIGGHAVTPVALRDIGKGRTGIVIYDNNFPGVEKMIVTDAGANKWYYTTSLNPADKSYLFVGSPQNQLLLGDLEPTTRIQDCPTCRDSGDDSVLVVVKDNAENSDGTIIGWDMTVSAPGGGDVEGIEVQKSLFNQQTVMFSVPADVAFEMNIDNVPAGRSTDIDVSLYGNGWINEIDNIVLQSGGTAKVGVDQSQRKLSLGSNGALEPELSLASEQSNWSVSAQGSGLQLRPGTTLTVEREPDGRFAYTLDGDYGSLMSLAVRRVDTVANYTMVTPRPMSLGGKSRASVHAGTWGGTSGLSVRVERTDAGPGDAATIYGMVPAD